MIIPIPLPQHQHTFCQRRRFDQDCPGLRQVEMNKLKSAWHTCTSGWFQFGHFNLTKTRAILVETSSLTKRVLVLKNWDADKTKHISAVTVTFLRAAFFRFPSCQNVTLTSSTMDRLLSYTSHEFGRNGLKLPVDHIPHPPPPPLSSTLPEIPEERLEVQTSNFLTFDIVVIFTPKTWFSTASACTGFS